MTKTGPRYGRYLLPTASFFGVLALAGGLYGSSNPIAWSGTMGVNVPDATSSVTPYVLFTAARNVAGGLTLLGLCALREQRAVGVYLMAGTSTALLDAWVCSQYGVEGKALGHAVMGLLVGGLGVALYRDF